MVYYFFTDAKKHNFFILQPVYMSSEKNYLGYRNKISSYIEI